VDASLALGKSVNVTGTPTLFINGRSIGNVSQIPAASLKGWWSSRRSKGRGDSGFCGSFGFADRPSYFSLTQISFVVRLAKLRGRAG
jgi:hypothetical protein